MSIAAFFVDEKVDTIDFSKPILVVSSITSTFPPLPHEKFRLPSWAHLVRSPFPTCKNVPGRASLRSSKITPHQSTQETPWHSQSP